VRAALAEMQEVYGLDSLAERRIRERFLLPPATLLDTVKAQAQLAEIAADEVAHAESPEGVYEVAHKALVSIANALHAAAAREKG
jgi:hypothetical protein